MVLTLAQDVRVLENFGGLEWAGHTTLHPIGLALTIICGLALLTLPRRLTIWPFILMACMVAPAQRLVMFGLDFNLIRILVLFGAARVISRMEYKGLGWTAVDSVLVAFSIVRTLLFTIQQASFSALVFQAGQTFDAIGLYFLFRCLIRSRSDLVRTIVGFAIISVPVLIAFSIEKNTGRNLFSIFGGVPEITLVREDRLRCQGAFAHPIIAGCFWASLLPLFAALWWQGITNRIWCIIGIVCTGVIVLFTASSTPVMGVLFGIFGWGMYFFRRWMRWIVLGACVLGIFLHFSMKAPVWHLICRITIAKGNTGYHRFQLIDNAIHRFGEWALFGTRSTAHWFWGGQDVTNQFVLEGVRGGFLTLVLFIATIWLCFRYVGRAWRVAPDRGMVVLAWALGVSLWVHCTNFIGVSYFGQGIFIWYLHLAMIVSMWELARRSAAWQAQLRSRRAMQPSANFAGGHTPGQPSHEPNAGFPEPKTLR